MQQSLPVSNNNTPSHYSFRILQLNCQYLLNLIVRWQIQRLPPSDPIKITILGTCCSNFHLTILCRTFFLVNSPTFIDERQWWLSYLLLADRYNFNIFDNRETTTTAGGQIGYGKISFIDKPLMNNRKRRQREYNGRGSPDDQQSVIERMPVIVVCPTIRHNNNKCIHIYKFDMGVAEIPSCPIKRMNCVHRAHLKLSPGPSTCVQQ